MSMKPTAIIIAAVLILTVGTVYFIKKGPPAPSPFRLMSPSRFATSQDMAHSLAARFYPIFMKNPKVIFLYSADFAMGPQIINDWIVELSRTGAPVQPEVSSISSSSSFLSNQHHWIIAELPREKSATVEESCQLKADENAIYCKAYRAYLLNQKKLITTDQLSAVAEFHQDKAYYLFILPPPQP